VSFESLLYNIYILENFEICPNFLERCVCAYKERRRFGRFFQACCAMNEEQKNYEEQQQESVI
jgi:hypothetical protein